MSMPARLPSASMRATILVVRPPREHPIARIPFCAGPVLVDPDDGSVDQKSARRPIHRFR